MAYHGYHGVIESDTEESQTDYHEKLVEYLFEDDSFEENISDAEDLSLCLSDYGLRKCLEGTRSKISLLQNDVIEMQQNLNREREMRLHAEQELSYISMEREEDHGTPSPIFNSTFDSQQLQSPKKTKTKDVNVENEEDINEMREQLGIATEQNKSLRSSYTQLEICHERLTQAKEDIRLELDAEFTARGAALVDKIYTAQKEREECMNSRLKRITDEKEELAEKIKLLEKEHGVDSGVETNSLGDELWVNADMSLDEIVGRVVNQNQSIEINGEFVVDRTNSKTQSMKKRSSPSSECFRRMKEERDVALKQVERLTEELHEAKRERSVMESQHRKNEKNRLKALQNQMKGVVKDRDKAVERSEILEEELEHLKLQQSLKNSLSNETSLRRQFTHTLDEYKSKLRDNTEELLAAQSSYSDIHSKLNATMDEKNEISAQLQEAISQSKEDKKRADKLERLLIALRRRKER